MVFLAKDWYDENSFIKIVLIAVNSTDWFQKDSGAMEARSDIEAHN